MWGKIVSSVSNVLDFNQATLSGCIDIICVESEMEKKHKGDKSEGNIKTEKNENDSIEEKTEFIYKSTPFHVRFGKTKLLRSKEKIVNILVNGKNTNLCMKLGSAGEAYFVEKTYEDVEEELETSPLASPRNEQSDSKYNDTVDKYFYETVDYEKNKLVNNDIHYDTNNLEKNKDTRGKYKKHRAEHKKNGNKETEKEKKNKLKVEYKEKQTNGEQNENSEWSWSWGRFPQLKNNEYNSDSCTILSSQKKRKKKKEKLIKEHWKSESGNENMLHNKDRGKKIQRIAHTDPNLMKKRERKKEKEKEKENERRENKKEAIRGKREKREKQESKENTTVEEKEEQKKRIEEKSFIWNHKNNEKEENIQKETNEKIEKEFNLRKDSLRLDLNKLQKAKDKGEIELEKQIDITVNNYDKKEHLSSVSVPSLPSASDDDASSVASYDSSSSYSSSYSNSSFSSYNKKHKRVNKKSNESKDRDYFDDDIQNRIDCSLCGHLLINQNTDSEYHDYNIEIHNKNIFEANIVTYEQIDKNSNLWYHPSLVFRFDRKEPYYPSRVALPLLASWVVFNQPISISAVEKLLNSSLNLTETKDKRWRKWFGVSNANYDKETIRNASKEEREKKEKENEKGYEEKSSGTKEYMYLEDLEKKNKTNFENCNNMVTNTNINNNGIINNIMNDNNNENKNDNTNNNYDKNMNNNITNYNFNDEDYISNYNAKEMMQRDRTSNEKVKKDVKRVEEKGKIRYRKSLRPTSEQLQSLNLKEGANTITFLVTSSLQGTKSINGTIYLWKKNSKIVISDVDGTITRSTVLGQIMPIVGKDWSHVGVAQLFSKIHNNGYHILYLTARAIGQADSTREYLFRFKKNDNNKLPDGPLILSPDRLFPSFKREVIDKKPYIFKIAALRDIKNLFPFNHNPFYAAFGNTESDHRAYISVGVPEAKVFIIDNKGIVHHVNSTYAKTYETMSEITEHMFPCIKNEQKREDDDQYNAFQYWKINNLSFYEKYMNISDSN